MRKLARLEWAAPKLPRLEWLAYVNLPCEQLKKEKASLLDADVKLPLMVDTEQLCWPDGSEQRKAFILQGGIYYTVWRGRRQVSNHYHPHAGQQVLRHPCGQSSSKILRS
jgi:hypothetical protein